MPRPALPLRVACVSRDPRRSLVSLFGLAACILAVACSGSDEATADTAAIPTPPSLDAAPAGPTAAGTGTLNDAQIAHVAVTANAIDSTAGEMAKQNAESQAVKDFAATMVTDHTGVNQQALALATRLNVSPEDNDVSQQLRAGADSALANLEGASGAAFDRAYMDREVAFHQTVLDALDRTLIPAARNAELKQLLQDVRPAIAAHLERARSVRDGLTVSR